MLRLARLVIAEQLSVRQIETRVRAELTPKKVSAGPARNANVRHLEESLQRALGCKVSLRSQGAAGVVELRYGSLDELDRLVERLVR